MTDHTGRLQQTAAAKNGTTAAAADATQEFYDAVRGALADGMAVQDVAAAAGISRRRVEQIRRYTRAALADARP